MKNRPCNKNSSQNIRSRIKRANSLYNKDHLIPAVKQNTIKQISRPNDLNVIPINPPKQRNDTFTSSSESDSFTDQAAHLKEQHIAMQIKYLDKTRGLR